MAGDPRLGELSEQQVGIVFQWTLFGQPKDFGSFGFSLGYDLSLLDYDQIKHNDTVGHIVSGSLFGAW